MFSYKGGYKYQLLQDYLVDLNYSSNREILSEYIELDKPGTLKIKKGYAWDGVTFWPDRKNMMRASLVHDALYQLISEQHLTPAHKSYSDKVFKNILIEDGVWGWLANIYHKGVSKFGQPFSKS